jgi:hypothetical protein
MNLNKIDSVDLEYTKRDAYTHYGKKVSFLNPVLFYLTVSAWDAMKTFSLPIAACALL